MRNLYAVALAGLVGAASAAACGTDAVDSTFTPEADGGPGGEDGSPPILGGGDSSVDPDGAAIVITPADQVVTFTGSGAAPTVQYVAKSAVSGVQVPASFSIDRGEIGWVNVGTGLFTASGKVGGKAKITVA